MYDIKSILDTVKYQPGSGIPKQVYQTFFSKHFHRISEQRMNKMKQLSSSYKFHLHNDEEIHSFVKNEVGGIIFYCFSKLNYIVAKTDLWRYLMLYFNGGIYLDIDSDIRVNLDDIIEPNDSAVISMENNEGKYVQWCLMFEKGHPILRKTIELVIDNILYNSYPEDVLHMTGPGVFSRAIMEIQKINGDIGIAPTHQNISNDTIWYSPNEIKYKIYGIDYHNKIEFKAFDSSLYYVGKPHWKTLKEPLLKNNRIFVLMSDDADMNDCMIFLNEIEAYDELYKRKSYKKRYRLQVFNKKSHNTNGIFIPSLDCVYDDS